MNDLQQFELARLERARSIAGRRFQPELGRYPGPREAADAQFEVWILEARVKAHHRKEPRDLERWLKSLQGRLRRHGTDASALVLEHLDGLLAEAQALATHGKPITAALFYERRAALEAQA